MFTRHQQRTMSADAALRSALALVILLLLSTQLRADINVRDLSPPGLLPRGIQGIARPIDSETDALVSQLWHVLEDHDVGRLKDAIATWQRLTLPNENEVWRHLPLGVAYLYMGQLDDAADELAVAQKQDAKNAAVHYFTGLLHMEQAEAASEYPDALRDARTRLVGHTPSSNPQQASHGKPKSRYELEAINELELAIKYAARVDLDAPLVAVCWVVAAPYPLTEPLTPPTVGDLLRVLGADNFVGKAHGLLAHLYLDHERPELAEHHVDQAGAHGILVLYGYRLVGELFEEQGRSTEALRAYMKALNGGDLLAQPDTKAVPNVGKAFEELF